MFLVVCKEYYCEVINLGIIWDVEVEVNDIFDKVLVLNVDILFIFGGVFMGDKDFVKLLF